MLQAVRRITPPPLAEAETIDPAEWLAGPQEAFLNSLPQGSFFWSIVRAICAFIMPLAIVMILALVIGVFLDRSSFEALNDLLETVGLPLVTIFLVIVLCYRPRIGFFSQISVRQPKSLLWTTAKLTLAVAAASFVVQFLAIRAAALWETPFPIHHGVSDSLFVTPIALDGLWIAILTSLSNEILVFCAFFRTLRMCFSPLAAVMIIITAELVMSLDQFSVAWFVTSSVEMYLCARAFEKQNNILPVLAVVLAHGATAGVL